MILKRRAAQTGSLLQRAPGKCAFAVAAALGYQKLESLCLPCRHRVQHKRGGLEAAASVYKTAAVWVDGIRTGCSSCVKHTVRNICLRDFEIPFAVKSVEVGTAAFGLVHIGGPFVALEREISFQACHAVSLRGGGLQHSGAADDLVVAVVGL